MGFPLQLLFPWLLRHKAEVLFATVEDIIVVRTPHDTVDRLGVLHKRASRHATLCPDLKSVNFSNYLDEAILTASCQRRALVVPLDRDNGACVSLGNVCLDASRLRDELETAISASEREHLVASFCRGEPIEVDARYLQVKKLRALKKRHRVRISYRLSVERPFPECHVVAHAARVKFCELLYLMSSSEEDHPTAETMSECVFFSGRFSLSLI